MTALKAFLISIALCGQAAMAGTAQAQDPQSFAHKQWKAACGVSYCTLHPSARQTIAFSRAHTGGPWLLSLEQTGSDTPLRFAIDGTAVDLPMDQAVPFPAVIMRGEVLDMVQDDVLAARRVSLAGLAAAMLWADEQQGVLGQTAQVLYRVPDWQSAAKSVADHVEQACGRPVLGDQDDQFEIMTIPNHPEVRAFGAVCWRAAYNIGSMLFILGPDLESATPFANAAWDGSSGKHIAVQDLATGFYSAQNSVGSQLPTFRTHEKGRGIGDCFTTDAYEFNGFVYTLTKRIEDQDCDGKIVPMQVYPQ